MRRKDTIISVIAGLAVGYVWWLLGFSLGGDNATVGRWGPVLLLMSVALAIVAAVWGWRLRQRGDYRWAAFASGLPVLPVLLTLAVLADAYL